MNSSPPSVQGRPYSHAGSNQTAVAAPRTQVESLLGELSHEIDQLEKSLGAHAAKLESVLRQEAEPLAKPECPPPEEMLVPVADRIRSQLKRIMSLRRGLENLTQRTEA